MHIYVVCREAIAAAEYNTHYPSRLYVSCGLAGGSEAYVS